MIHEKKLIAFTMAFFLTACGSSGSDDREKSVTPSEASGSAAEIAGVWDLSAEAETSSGDYGMDEAYLIITPEGQYYEYDYKGDAFASLWGDSENCYEKSTVGTITKLENGSFYVDINIQEVIFIEQQADYSIVDGKLSAPATLLNPNGARISIDAVSGITLDEMQSMECEDQSVINKL